MLIINRVEYNDNSKYTCVAKNPAGEASMTVDINVLVKPRIYELLNVTADVSNQTKIICKAYGRPAPKVLFRKLNLPDFFQIGEQPDNKRIILEQNVNEEKGETYGVLIIEKLNRTDDGLYECMAENKAGKAYTNGHITVEFPPTFEKVKNYPPVWTWNNRPANLTCIAESIPNATIIWRLGNVEIKENNNYNMVIEKGRAISSLIIKYFEPRLFTKYECIATNRLGSASHYIELKKGEVPAPVRQARAESITATTIKFDIVPPANLHGLPLRRIMVQYKREDELTGWDFARNHSWSVGMYFTIYLPTLKADYYLNKEKHINTI